MTERTVYTALHSPVLAVWSGGRDSNQVPEPAAIADPAQQASEDARRSGDDAQGAGEIKAGASGGAGTAAPRRIAGSAASFPRVIRPGPSRPARELSEHTNPSSSSAEASASIGQGGEARTHSDRALQRFPPAGSPVDEREGKDSAVTLTREAA